MPPAQCCTDLQYDQRALIGRRAAFCAPGSWLAPPKPSCSVWPRHLQAVSDSEDYGDGYATDLMGDEADRARLANMTELDRELELLDRSEKRQELKMKRDLAKQQQQQQAAADKVSALVLVLA